MNMTLRRIAAFAIISACTLSAGAQPFTFTRIIDSNTEIPDSGGKQFHGDAFSNLSISQQRVVFQGMGPGTSGIYEWVNGSLNRIADTTTVTPGAGGLFTMFGPGIDNSGEHASFVGRSGSTGGLYRRSGDVLQRVVDTTLTAPNGGVYGAIGIPSVEGTSIAFFAGHVVGPSAVPSVYRWDSGITTTVADTNTPVPGGQGNFTFFSPTTSPPAASTARPSTSPPSPGPEPSSLSRARHSGPPDAPGSLTRRTPRPRRVRELKEDASLDTPAFEGTARVRALRPLRPTRTPRKDS